MNIDYTTNKQRTNCFFSKQKTKQKPILQKKKKKHVFQKTEQKHILQKTKNSKKQKHIWYSTIHRYRGVSSNVLTALATPKPQGDPPPPPYSCILALARPWEKNNNEKVRNKNKTIISGPILKRSDFEVQNTIARSKNKQSCCTYTYISGTKNSADRCL